MAPNPDNQKSEIGFEDDISKRRFYQTYWLIQEKLLVKISKN